MSASLLLRHLIPSHRHARNQRLIKIHKRWILSTYARNYQSEEERRQHVMSKGLPKLKPIDGVKHILLVASGKGGVGKSTISANLATALKVVEPEKEVGLLDTDIFGPTIPLMMNLSQPPILNHEKMMEPLVNYGVKCMSMGFMVKQNSPVIWRGLMVMSAIDKLLRNVTWNGLDYLIIDTPPGTGDTLLSLIQNLPLDGVLMVTTPQKAAINVALKGARMFEKMDVPIAGIVENMSYLTCPKCKEKTSLFGDGGAYLADELGVPVLCKVPLDKATTECGDAGKPVVLAKPLSEQACIYKDLAKQIIYFLENNINQ